MKFFELDEDEAYEPGTPLQWDSGDIASIARSIDDYVSHRRRNNNDEGGSKT